MYKIFFTMKTIYGVLLILVVCITGCVHGPYSVTRLKIPDESNRAEVVVFRGPAALNAGSVLAAFGTADEFYVMLRRREYASLFLPPQTYQFYVRDIGRAPSIAVTVNLKANDRRCLKVSASSANFAKALVPIILMATGYSFYLEEVNCPSHEELENYSRVDVEYENK